MKRLVAFFIMLFVALPALSQTSQSRIARHEDIREAVIRYQITKYPQAASLYFVSIEDEKTGKKVDASDELVRRFAGEAVRIEKASMARAEATGYVDKKSGEPGEFIYIGDLRRLSEHKVSAYILIEGPSGGVGLRATIEQHDVSWEVSEFKSELFLDYPQRSGP